MRYLLGTCTILAAAAFAAGSPADAVSIEVGRSFPPLVLPRLSDGGPASIADFRGRRVVLHVFASW